MKGALLILVAIAAVLVAMAVGAVPMPIASVLEGALHPGSAAGQIIWDLRLPRIVLAFLVGGALGVSGTALQALVRNPLAEPYLLGISGGAGLGAVAAIALGAGGLAGVPLAAFGGALASSRESYRSGLVRLDHHARMSKGASARAKAPAWPCFATVAPVASNTASARFVPSPIQIES